MIKLKVLIEIAGKHKITLQQALSLCRKKSTTCPHCKNKSLLAYYHENGIVENCLFCDAYFE